jgi:hypothetical protein
MSSHDEMTVSQMEACLQATAIRELRVRMYSTNQGQFSAKSIHSVREKLLMDAFLNVEWKSTTINTTIIQPILTDQFIQDKILPHLGTRAKISAKPADTQGAMSVFKDEFHNAQALNVGIRFGISTAWNILVNAVQWIFTYGVDILTDNTLPMMKRIAKFFGALLGSTVAVGTKTAFIFTLVEGILYLIDRLEPFFSPLSIAAARVDIAAVIPWVFSTIMLFYKKNKGQINGKQLTEGLLINTAMTAIGTAIGYSVTMFADTNAALFTAFAISALITVFFVIVENNREIREETNIEILWRMVSSVFGYQPENHLPFAAELFW